MIMKKQMDFMTVSAITTAIGLTLIAMNFIYFSKYPQAFSTLNLISGAIVLGVPLTYRYIMYNKVKKIESIFPIFLRDITENINAGMTLPQAIRSTSRNNYDIFTPYSKEMAAKISWGITFERVLEDFSHKIGSKNMKRTVQAIIEAHHSGGSMNTVLEGIAISLQEMEKIRKERSASIYSQMINGYLIYVVFLGVMIGLSSFLLPAFEFGEQAAGLQEAFPELFRSLIVIQAIFAGLSVGKMAEGTLVAGVKHALALAAFGYTAFMVLG